MANPNEGRRLEDIYRGIEDRSAGMSVPVDMSTPDGLQVGQTERTLRRTAPVSPPRSAAASQEDVIRSGLQSIEELYKRGGMDLGDTGGKKRSVGRLPESGFLGQGDALLPPPSGAAAIGLQDQLPGPRGRSVGEPGLGASRGATARFADFEGQPALPPAQARGGPLEIATGGPQSLQVVTGPLAPPPASAVSPFAPPAAQQPLPAYLTEEERATLEQATPGERALAGAQAGSQWGKRQPRSFDWAYPNYGG